MEFTLMQLDMTLGTLLKYIGNIFMIAGAISLAASFLRVFLDYLEEPLHIWTTNQKLFNFLDKVETTLAWLSVSLQKFGSQKGQIVQSITTLVESKPAEVKEAVQIMTDDTAAKAEESKPDIVVVEVKNSQP